jgi:hypothetical protein
MFIYFILLNSGATSVEVAMNVHRGHSSLLTFFNYNYLEHLDSFIINDLKKRGDLTDEDK